MSSLAEIEAAALQLSYEEQQELLAKLEKAVQGAEAVRKDPVLAIIGSISDPGESTDIASNYEDYLYGHGPAY